MMNSSTNMNPDFIWKLFEKFRRPLGLFLVLVLTSILQHIFDLHFVCSCQPGGQRNDVLYMLLPSVILTLAVYIVKIFYKQKFFSTEDGSTWTRLCFPKIVIEFFSLTALWIAMVLFDGDWYFCVKTNSNLNQTGLPCKKILTDEEERIKDSYKTESVDIGLGVCCGLLLFWSFYETLRKRYRPECLYPRHYYVTKYKKILSDELSSCIEEKLKEIAKTKAEEMLKQKMTDIKDPELPQNNRRENGDSQIWKDISDPSFLWKYQRQDMTERNPANNAETSDQSETPGRIQDEQEGLNL